MKSHYFNLHVIVPTAFILGSDEYHTQAGNAISLVCIIENVRKLAFAKLQKFVCNNIKKVIAIKLANYVWKDFVVRVDVGIIQLLAKDLSYL